MEQLIREWLMKLKSSKDPISTMRAFALGIHASTMHDAADALAEVDDDGDCLCCNLIRSMAEQADANYAKEIAE